MANGNWTTRYDENGNPVYTWKDYVVRQTIERRPTSASYLNPQARGTFEDKILWRAAKSGQLLRDFDSMLEALQHCEQLDDNLK